MWCWVLGLELVEVVGQRRPFWGVCNEKGQRWFRAFWRDNDGVGVRRVVVYIVAQRITRVLGRDGKFSCKGKGDFVY